jgi:hypothetical protein
MRNIVLFLFWPSSQKIRPQSTALTNGLTAKACGIREGGLMKPAGPVWTGLENQSLAQWALSASGRAAQCAVNPYLAHAEPSPRHYKRLRRGY